MLTYLAIGVGLVLLLHLAVRFFSHATPHMVRMFGIALAVIMGIASIFLLLRIGQAQLASLVGSLMVILPLMKKIAGLFARVRPQRSHLKTEKLEVSIGRNHIRGTMLQGKYEGVSLGDISLVALREYYLDWCNSDPESAEILALWLDKQYHGDWRDDATEKASPKHPKKSQPPMDKAEAAAILSISEDATPDTIRAAHKKLMQRNHPDSGGSEYLASKINQARDVLLGK